MIDARVQALCVEFEIRIVGHHRYPEIGETRAVETLRLIIHRFGMDHARMVMRTLAETSNNKACLDEVGFWMASDMVRACRQLIEQQPSEWLETWDAIPVGELQFITQELRGIVKQRHALGGMVFERIYKRFGPNAAQMDLLDDRRGAK
ncbi:hypothetical protein ACFPLB_04235 [Aquamicrobium segne]|uniref:Uncharacterized protein n=1 Tax=Aquamicrobium segne TaxID=469547 RepID=A0ABW0GZJ1_9HYPH